MPLPRRVSGTGPALPYNGRAGLVAQGIEQWFPKPCVGGSNPPGAASANSGLTRYYESHFVRLMVPLWDPLPDLVGIWSVQEWQWVCLEAS